MQEFSSYPVIPNLGVYPAVLLAGDLKEGAEQNLFSLQVFSAYLKYYLSQNHISYR
jgi:hypothetical protein